MWIRFLPVQFTYSTWKIKIFLLVKNAIFPKLLPKNGFLIFKVIYTNSDPLILNLKKLPHSGQYFNKLRPLEFSKTTQSIKKTFLKTIFAKALLPLQFFLFCNVNCQNNEISCSCTLCCSSMAWWIRPWTSVKWFRVQSQVGRRFSWCRAYWRCVVEYFIIHYSLIVINGFIANHWLTNKNIIIFMWCWLH